MQRMTPLNNLQVAVKNNIDIFYFSCIVPVNVYFVEDGEMGKLYNLSSHSLSGSTHHRVYHQCSKHLFRFWECHLASAPCI